MLCRVAICDDNPTDLNYVQTMLKSWADNRQVDLLVEQFPSAEAFLFRYEEEKAFDILLLDIEMGKMDGVTMAKKIRAGNETVQIVFITGYSDYIAEGYEVEALHYLMTGQAVWRIGPCSGKIKTKRTLFKFRVIR